MGNQQSDINRRYHCDPTVWFSCQRYKEVTIYPPTDGIVHHRDNHINPLDDDATSEISVGSVDTTIFLEAMAVLEPGQDVFEVYNRLKTGDFDQPFTTDNIVLSNVVMGHCGDDFPFFSREDDMIAEDLHRPFYSYLQDLDHTSDYDLLALRTIKRLAKENLPSTDLIDEEPFIETHRTLRGDVEYYFYTITEYVKTKCLLYKLELLIRRCRPRFVIYVAVATGGIALLLLVGSPYLFGYGSWVLLKTFSIIIFNTICGIVSHPLGLVCGIGVLAGGAIYLTSQYQPLNVEESTIRCGIRHQFVETIYKTMRHCSHPHAAAERSEMRTQIIIWAQKMGLGITALDASQSDIRWSKDPKRNINVQRAHYVDKDTCMQTFHNEVRPGDICIFIDSDEYRFIPSLAASNICIMYTIMIERSAGEVKNGLFSVGPSFNNNDPDAVNFSFQGGASYSHQLWNYNRDHFSVNGIFGRTVVKVETRRVSPNRYVVLTLPVSWVPYFHWSLDPNRRLQEGGEIVLTKRAPPLTRMKLNYNGIIVVRSIDPDGKDMISLAHEGNTSDCYLPYRAFRAAQLAYLRSKSKCSADVQVFVSQFWRDNEIDVKYYPSNCVLFADILSKLGFLKFDNIQIMGLPSSFQCDITKQETWDIHDPALMQVVDHNNLGGARPLGHSCGPALMPGKYVPCNNDIAQKQCITERVVNVRAAKSTDQQINEDIHMSQRFAREVFPGLEHTLSPWNHERVNEVMNKPQQRAKYILVLGRLNQGRERKQIIKAFQKAESIKFGGANRMIQPDDDEARVELSQYTLAAAEHLKQLPFYAFGKTPYDIAQRVHHVGVNSQTLVLSDFSSFDGTKCDRLAHACLHMLLYLFHPAHHEDIRKCVESEWNTTGYLGDNKYKIGYNQLSGSPNTALFNSWSNMYVAWRALMKCKDPRDDKGRNYTPSTALLSLGCYGGDDGMTADINVDKYKQTAEDYQLKLKVESAQSSSQPITFLARIYINPQATSESVCDVKRVLSKIHLTFGPPEVPDHVVWARKAISLAITDPTTPVISNMIALLRRSANKTYHDEVSNIGRYWNEELGYVAGQTLGLTDVTTLKKALYDNVSLPRAYPVPVDSELTESIIMDQLGIFPDAYQALKDSIDDAVDFRSLTAPPLPGIANTTKQDLIVGGRLHLAGTGIDEWGNHTGKPLIGIPPPPTGEIPKIKRVNKPPPPPPDTASTSLAGSSGLSQPSEQYCASDPTGKYTDKVPSRGFGNNKKIVKVKQWLPAGMRKIVLDDKGRPVGGSPGFNAPVRDFIHRCPINPTQILENVRMQQNSSSSSSAAQ